MMREKDREMRREEDREMRREKDREMMREEDREMLREKDREMRREEEPGYSARSASVGCTRSARIVGTMHASAHTASIRIA